MLELQAQYDHLHAEVAKKRAELLNTEKLMELFEQDLLENKAQPDFDSKMYERAMHILGTHHKKLSDDYLATILASLKISKILEGNLHEEQA